MRHYLHTPWPYPGSSGACSSSWRSSKGLGLAGATVAEAGRGDGKNVCVTLGRGCGFSFGVASSLQGHAETLKRRGGLSQNQKGHRLVEVMALLVELGGWSAFGYITPLSSAGQCRR